MKTKTYQSDVQRSILIGAITNTQILGKILTGIKAEKKPFKDKWCNQVFNWCRDFYSKYQRAPRESIKVLFLEWSETVGDDSSVGIIEKFLDSLNDDYKTLSKEINEQHLIDRASDYFSLVRFERLKEKIEAGIARKDIGSIRESMGLFSPVSFSASSMINVLTDVEAWRDAVTPREDDVLVEYPGAIGEFFGRQLKRGGFISFLAPEKRGKSFWLIDFAYRAAIFNKRKVMFFSVGDMSTREVLQRFIPRAALRPLRATYDNKRNPKPVSFPKEISRTGDGGFGIVTKTVMFEKHISPGEAEAARKKILERTASSVSFLKLEGSPNSTTSVSDIGVRIEESIKEEWVPDIVVIDYADILAPEPGSSGMEPRHAMNESWKAMRRLSQKYHVLVMTATQTNSAAYDGKLLTMKSFSEDKRKFAHVTGMVGLNQSEEQKAQGIFQPNWILLREGEYHGSKKVTTAGCLAIANPCMASTW